MNDLHPLAILGISLITFGVIIASWMTIATRQADKRLNYWRARLQAGTLACFWYDNDEDDSPDFRVKVCEDNKTGRVLVQFLDTIPAFAWPHEYYSVIVDDLYPLD